MGPASGLKYTFLSIDSSFLIYSTYNTVGLRRLGEDNREVFLHSSTSCNSLLLELHYFLRTVWRTSRLLAQRHLEVRRRIFLPLHESLRHFALQLFHTGEVYTNPPLNMDWSDDWHTTDASIVDSIGEPRDTQKVDIWQEKAQKEFPGDSQNLAIQKYARKHEVKGIYWYEDGKRYVWGGSKYLPSCSYELAC